MIERGKNTQGRFSNAFYGHLCAFAPGARRDNPLLSVANVKYYLAIVRKNGKLKPRVKH